MSCNQQHILSKPGMLGGPINPQDLWSLFRDAAELPPSSDCLSLFSPVCSVRTYQLSLAAESCRTECVGYYACTKCPAFWSCLDCSGLNVFVIAGEMCKQKYEESVIIDSILLSVIPYNSSSSMYVVFIFSIHTLPTLHSSQVNIHIIKGKLSSGSLQNISSGLEMVNKKQPYYFFPPSPQNTAS